MKVNLLGMNHFSVARHTVKAEAPVSQSRHWREACYDIMLKQTPSKESCHVRHCVALIGSLCFWPDYAHT